MSDRQNQGLLPTEDKKRPRPSLAGCLVEGGGDGIALRGF